MYKYLWHKVCLGSFYSFPIHIWYLRMNFFLITVDVRFWITIQIYVKYICTLKGERGLSNIMDPKIMCGAGIL